MLKFGIEYLHTLIKNYLFSTNMYNVIHNINILSIVLFEYNILKYMYVFFEVIKC